jgi:hypothetical protein
MMKTSTPLKESWMARAAPDADWCTPIPHTKSHASRSLRRSRTAARRSSERAEMPMAQWFLQYLHERFVSGDKPRVRQKHRTTRRRPCGTGDFLPPKKFFGETPREGCCRKICVRRTTAAV